METTRTLYQALLLPKTSTAKSSETMFRRDWLTYNILRTIQGDSENEIGKFCRLIEITSACNYKKQSNICAAPIKP